MDESRLAALRDGVSHPLIVAHRGASKHAPENSLQAVEIAIAQGADMIEVDIRRTVDGVLVAHHDPNIGRVPLHSMSFDFVRAAVPHIATLEQLVKAMAGRVLLDLEIKIEGYERDVLDVLRHRMPASDVIVTSFSPRVLRRVRRLDASAKTGWIVGIPRPRDVFSRHRLSGAHWLVAERACVDVETVAECRARGIPLAVWTVNQWSEIEAVLRVPGLTALITDVPDVGRRLRDRYLWERARQAIP